MPTAVIGPLAGAFVDRWEKRRTMLWADALRAVLIGLLYGAGERSLLVLSAGIYATLTFATLRDVSIATKTASISEEE